MIGLRTPIFVVQNWMFWPENDRYKNEFPRKCMISGDAGEWTVALYHSSYIPICWKEQYQLFCSDISSKIWTQSYSSTTVCNEQNLISTTRCLILSMRHVLFDKFVSDWAIAPVNSLRCALGEWQRFLLWEFFDLPNQISILFVRWWIWMHESNDWILKTKERVPPGRATISSNIWDTMLFQPTTAAVVHKAFPTIPLRTSPFSSVAYGGYLTLVTPFSKQCKGKCLQRI